MFSIPLHKQDDIFKHVLVLFHARVMVNVWVTPHINVSVPQVGRVLTVAREHVPTIYLGLPSPLQTTQRTYTHVLNVAIVVYAIVRLAYAHVYQALLVPRVHC